MDKRKLHHLWTRLRAVRYLYILVPFIVVSAVFVWAYRENNLEMIRLRNAVYEADENGGDVAGALNDLRKHVYSHMNTDLAAGDNAIYPPIQLKNTYERLQMAEQDRVSKANEQIYKQAQIECEKRFPAGLSGGSRVPCIEEYVSNRGEKEKEIPKELYQFDFISPVWSPDLAGWSLLVSLVLLVLLIVRFLLERWLKHSFE